MIKLDERFKWLARDKDDDLYAFSDKPVKSNFATWDMERSANDGKYSVYIDESDSTYSFIKWEDEEPTKIEDALNKIMSEQFAKVGQTLSSFDTPTDQHTKICKELNEIYQSKNADYGDAFSDTYNKLGVISAVTRISDKTNRLITLATKTDEERLVKEETIKDTLMDLANYAIMTLVELDK